VAHNLKHAAIIQQLLILSIFGAINIDFINGLLIFLMKVTYELPFCLILDGFEYCVSH